MPSQEFMFFLRFHYLPQIVMKFQIERCSRKRISNKAYFFSQLTLSMAMHILIQLDKLRYTYIVPFVVCFHTICQFIQCSHIWPIIVNKTTETKYICRKRNWAQLNIYKLMDHGILLTLIHIHQLCLVAPSGAFLLIVCCHGNDHIGVMLQNYDSNCACHQWLW